MHRQTVRNLDSRSMWHILVSVISFKFLIFCSSPSAYYSLGEVRRKLTGTMKGSKSLKQYVSRRYLMDSTGVEYLILRCFSVDWKDVSPAFSLFLRLTALFL